MLSRLIDLLLEYVHKLTKSQLQVLLIAVCVSFVTGWSVYSSSMIAIKAVETAVVSKNESQDQQIQLLREMSAEQQAILQNVGSAVERVEDHIEMHNRFHMQKSASVSGARYYGCNI